MEAFILQIIGVETVLSIFSFSGHGGWQGGQHGGWQGGLREVDIEALNRYPKNWFNQQ